eukprot:gene4376-14501_t
MLPSLARSLLTCTSNLLTTLAEANMISPQLERLFEGHSEQLESMLQSLGRGESWRGVIKISAVVEVMVTPQVDDHRLEAVEEVMEEESLTRSTSAEPSFSPAPHETVEESSVDSEAVSLAPLLTGSYSRGGTCPPAMLENLVYSDQAQNSLLARSYSVGPSPLNDGFTSRVHRLSTGLPQFESDLRCSSSLRRSSVGPSWGTNGASSSSLFGFAHLPNNKVMSLIAARDRYMEKHAIHHSASQQLPNQRLSKTMSRESLPRVVLPGWPSQPLKHPPSREFPSDPGSLDEGGYYGGVGDAADRLERRTIDRSFSLKPSRQRSDSNRVAEDHGSLRPLWEKHGLWSNPGNGSVSQKLFILAGSTRPEQDALLNDVGSEDSSFIAPWRGPYSHLSIQTRALSRSTHSPSGSARNTPRRSHIGISSRGQSPSPTNLRSSYSRLTRLDDPITNEIIEPRIFVKIKTINTINGIVTIKTIDSINAIDEIRINAIVTIKTINNINATDEIRINAIVTIKAINNIKVSDKIGTIDKLWTIDIFYGKLLAGDGGENEELVEDEGGHDNLSEGGEGGEGETRFVPPRQSKETDDESAREVVYMDEDVFLEIQALPTTDAVTGDEAILLLQTDITNRAKLEERMATLTEAQLSMLENHMVMAHDVNGGTSNLASLACSHSNVTIMFMDVVGFTAMSKEMSSGRVMGYLNELFTQLDDLVDAHQVYKVDTAGDCYIVAGGLMSVDADNIMALDDDPDHQEAAQRMLEFVKILMQTVRNVSHPLTGKPTVVRVGLHTGSCVSGLIGTKLPKFSLWGDTMNTPKPWRGIRMESYSRLGMASISESMTVPDGPHAVFSASGGMSEAEGKGTMQTYLWAPSDTEAETTGAVVSSHQTSGRMEGSLRPPAGLFHVGSPFSLAQMLKGDELPSARNTAEVAAATLKWVGSPSGTSTSMPPTSPDILTSAPSTSINSGPSTELPDISSPESRQCHGHHSSSQNSLPKLEAGANLVHPQPTGGLPIASAGAAVSSQSTWLSIHKAVKCRQKTLSAATLIKRGVNKHPNMFDPTKSCLCGNALERRFSRNITTHEGLNRDSISCMAHSTEHPPSSTAAMMHSAPLTSRLNAENARAQYSGTSPYTRSSLDPIFSSFGGIATEIPDGVLELAPVSYEASLPG